MSDAGSPYTKTAAIISNSDGTAPAELQFWTKTDGQSSPAERMRIDSNGNVGIGTSNPQYSTDFVSDSDSYATVAAAGIGPDHFTGIHFGYREEGSTNYRKSGIVFERTGGAAQGKIHILNDIAPDDGSMELADAKLTISDNGYVGIGTSSPVGTLSIEGTGTYNSTIWGQNADINLRSSELTDDAANAVVQIAMIRQSLTTGKDSEGYIGFSSIDDSNNAGMLDGARIQIHNTSSGAIATGIEMSFWTNVGTLTTTPATEAMRIDSNGNVGIGTSDPQELLHLLSLSTHSSLEIETTATTYNAAIKLTSSDTWQITSAGSGSDNGAGTFVISSDAGGLHPGRFYIDSDGNVGIGDKNEDDDSLIYFASDAYIFWNDSVDYFEVSKPIRFLKGQNTVASLHSAISYSEGVIYSVFSPYIQDGDIVVAHGGWKNSSGINRNQIISHIKRTGSALTFYSYSPDNDSISEFTCTDGESTTFCVEMSIAI